MKTSNGKNQLDLYAQLFTSGECESRRKFVVNIDFGVP